MPDRERGQRFDASAVEVVQHVGDIVPLDGSDVGEADLVEDSPAGNVVQRGEGL